MSATQVTSGVNANASKILQTVYVEDVAYSSTTTLMVFDDTKPQITEGTEFLTVDITPSDAANILWFDVTLQWNTGLSTSIAITSLFKTGTSDAIFTAFQQQTGNLKRNVTTFTCRAVAGGTSSQTYSIRCGSHSADTYYRNGTSGSREFGGSLVSSMTIREETP